MRERPILFSAPMVRAILDGTKTQTRRVVSRQPERIEKYEPGKPWQYATDRSRWNWHNGAVVYHENERCCPFGAAGDLLWVREAWGVGNLYDRIKPRDLKPRGMKVNFAADNALVGCKVRPAMFMPRWASRLTLCITDVRVERLQDISEADAEAEGIAFMREHPDADETLTARELYEVLWDSINTKRAPWESNPWVWALTFECAAVQS